MSMKKSHNIIGNRTCDLPACSAVPQPTALPRAPKLNKCLYNICVDYSGGTRSRLTVVGGMASGSPC
jgi:hypothetical protein